MAFRKNNYYEFINRFDKDGFNRNGNSYKQNS